MSQVIRKYLSGKPIKLEADKLFERQGFGSYKRDDIAKKLAQGVESYISNNNMNEKDAKAFRDVVSQAILGVQNGQFVKMDTQGIHNTMNLNSNGLTENKRFLGIDTGRQRSFEKSASTDDGKNNALNELNKFFALTLDSMSTYDYDKELLEYNSKNPKQKYNANTFLTDAISREWYGGNNIDWNNFSQNRTEQERRNLIGSIFNNANYEDLFNKYDWEGSNIKNAQDLANLFKSFGTNITNGTIDNNDYNTFAALGGKDLNLFLHGVKSQESAQQPIVEGQQGKIDTNWTHTDYDRTIDDKGKYHIYKKGTNEEVNGIIPGNVFEGVGNKYVFDGNIYDDSNLPEQYKLDIVRARQAQLGNYTLLTDNNPFTKMLRNLGYNYITNLSQFASGIGNNILYGTYSNPSDVNGKIGYYLKDPTTGKAASGNIEYNSTLGEYQFIGNNGAVINLGSYNKNGTLTNLGTTFVNYNDTSENNQDTLFSAWLRNSDLNNPASDAYKMVQNTLSKWIASKKSPFVNYDNTYQWKSGDDIMNVRKGANGQWEWKFNSGFDDSKESLDKQLEALLRIPVNQRTREINDKILRLLGYKNGGIISALLGVKFTKVDDKLLLERPKLSEELIKRNEKAHLSFTGRSNISLGNNKEITDAGGVLKTSDKVRLGAAMADLASIGLGFIPGANLASAGIGVGSSLVEFGADWASDGLDLGDAGRLAMNLGMDALSLIPIGKTMKATRALGKIRKSIPLIMTAINAANFLDPSIRAEYNKTLSKLTSGDIKSLNTGDFKNLSAIASTVLMGKNLAKSHKGFWNTNTTDSGKRRVTAMIDGKQQSLELDESFFKNTKGKNQVQELKNKFAEQYNKQNNLEGDKAIKPENVTVDTKYFGRRPLSEKVKGTSENNWLSNSWIGSRFLAYRDPSVVRGNKNIPFSDAWFLKSKNTSDSGSSKTSKKELLALPAPGQIHRVFHMDASKPKAVKDVTNPAKLNKPGTRIDSTSPVESASVKSSNSNAKRLDQFIEDLIPGGLVYGRARAKREKEYRDIFHPVAEAEYNKIWDDMIKNKKDFGYEEITPRRNPYAPPTPTEIYITPQQSIIDKNARYLWELANNKKSSTAHIKRTELPHKNSNKKKKTSRDNNIKRREFGGIIFKDGGLIPKYLGGNVMLRGVKGTWLNNNNTFKDATDLNSWDSYYDINGIINDITKSGTLSSSNADDWVKTANQLSSMNLPWNKQLNAKGYNDWNTLYSSTGLNTYFGEDKGRFDYLGPSTWNRRLLLQELGNRYNSMDNPLSVGQDKVWYDNGTWKKVVPLSNEIPTPQAAPLTPVQPVKTSLIGTATPSKNKMPKISVLPEDVLALGRMVGGLAVNNRAAKLYKEGLKPTLLDTFENTVPLQGNSLAKYSANNLASSLYSMASKPRTSDASLQLAGELEATNKARQLLFLGDLADSEMFYKTRMLGQQESDAAKARRVEVANKNRVALNAIDQAKKQIDAGRITANYQQVLAPYLAGVENQFRQNRAMKNLLAMEQYLNNSRTAYDAELTGLLSKYKDNEIEFNRQRRLLDDKYSKEILNKRKQLIESPWLIQLSKSGSKLTYKERAALLRAKDFNKRLLDDNKQFHKDIMESKREHNKLIVNLSKLTAELIKKGMQL